MTDREIFEKALEALDSDNPDIQLRAAVALRTAIAEAEKQEPVYLVEDDFGLFRIADKADYTYWSSTGRHKTFVANATTPPAAQRQWALADAIRAEPTEMIHKWRVLELVKEHAVAQRQPLTDEQIEAAYKAASKAINYCAPSHFDFARAIEAAHGIGGKA